MPYSRVHGIPGRVRVRFESSTGIGNVLNGDGGERVVEGFLAANEGIEAVKINRSARSLVLTYDPAVLSEESVVGLVAKLTPDSLTESNEGEQESSHALVPASQSQDEESASRLPLVLSTAAVAVSFVAESFLVPVLTVAAALPIYKRAIASLARRRLNVDVLDAIATVFLGANGQFGTAAAMTWLVALGDYIRDATVENAHAVIKSLFDGRVQTAWVVRDGDKKKIPINELRKGDMIVVYAGELIPADGTVTEGKATVDQSILTGESMLVVKDVGHVVYAGTVLREGKVYFRADHVGGDTMASKIISLIEQAPTRETRIQNYAEQFADRMVPWSLLGAGTSMALTGSINATAAFLIADYGTGIRVAAPTTVLSSLAAAARQGILIKGGGRYLEVLAEVDVIVFDKTGTLTKGIPELVEVRPIGNGLTSDGVLTLAAAAEQRLSHPFAQAIERSANAAGLEVPERESSDYSIGLGVAAQVQGYEVLVGCDRFMEQAEVELDGIKEEAEALDDGTTSSIFVALNRRLVGLLVFRVPLHEESPDVVKALRERGIRDVVMLTGDNPAAAERVAHLCGIEWFVGSTLPQEKCEFVKFLQRQGHKVALVGDGVNDSPALAQADVGIAVRGGTDVASQTAHVLLLEGDLWKIPHAIDIARESVRLIKQSWQLNFYPNTAAIGLSVAGLLGPVGATLISNGSAILSTLNGLRPLMGGRTPEALLPPPSKEAVDEALGAPLPNLSTDAKGRESTNTLPRLPLERALDEQPAPSTNGKGVAAAKGVTATASPPDETSVLE